MKGTCVILFSASFFFFNRLHGQDLAFYIEQAKNNSPVIQASKNQSEAARLEAERIKSLYTRAQVSLTGSYLFSPIISRDQGRYEFVINPVQADKYSGYDLAASNGGVYQGLLNINQPLFNNSRYQSAAEQTLISAKINENKGKLTAHDLEKTVADQYILCLQDHHQIEYLRELIQIIIDQKNLIIKLVESGIVKQSDLSLILIEEKNQETALNTFESTYRRDLMDLRVLCGIADTAYQVLGDIDLQLKEDVVSSQFIESYRLDSLDLVAAQEIFELKYKPQVGLFANTGLNAVYAPTIPNRFGLSAGLNFSLNIADGKQRRISQERTNVLMRSTTSNIKFFNVQNTVRKNGILAELASVDNRQRLMNEQLIEYNTLLELYKQELKVGQISVISYVIALKERSAVQRDLVILNTNKKLLINLYNYWNW